MNTELTTTNQNPFAIQSLDQAAMVAEKFAAAGLFGIKTKEQAFSLLYLSREQGKTLSEFFQEWHVMEDGKISKRADFTQAQFEQNAGWIIWHVRSDDMVCGTFGLGDEPTEEARQRGIQRFDLLWKLSLEESPDKRGALLSKLAQLSFSGEETVLRTFADAQAKGITEGRHGTKANWKVNPKAMLTARCVTEGVRLVAPGQIAGAYSEDELLDVAKWQQEEKKLAIESGDSGAIQAMIDQHLQSATHASSREEKSRYLGLAAELRDKLHASAPVHRDDPANTAMAQRMADARAGTQKPAQESPEPKSAPVPLPEKQGDARPTNPQTAPPVSEPAFTVEPPPKFGPENWGEYTIKTTRSSTYRGKKLSEFTPEEIQVLHAYFMKKDLPAEKEEVRKEAVMVSFAHEAHFGHPEEVK